MEKLLLKVPEAADLIGVSRARCYQLIASGELPSVKVGALTRVPYAHLKAWVVERIEAQGAATAITDE